jgi:hypothetical protein
MKLTEFLQHLNALDPEAEVLLMHYDGYSWEYQPVAVPAGVKTDKSNLILLTAQLPGDPE